MRCFDYTQYVNTNIGTVGHLLQATSPNVQSPHGLAVIAPIFRAGMKDRYFSDKIFGFSAGNAIVMPTCLTDAPDYEKTASVFDHDFEIAKPDHYEVALEDFGIYEKHTANENYGMFEFNFGANASRAVAIYISNPDSVKQDGDFLYVTSAKQFEIPVTTVFYIGKCGVSVSDCLIPNHYQPQNKEKGKAVLLSVDKETFSLPFAVSPLGSKSALLSYKTNVSQKAYSDILSECKAAWNELLSRVRVTGQDENRKIIFYTALYRAFSRMHKAGANGEYIGYDGNVHKEKGSAYMVDDGIWDTYRGMHPLQLLLDPKGHADTLESYLRMYKESGWLPRFPHLKGNAPCMIGHHTVSLFAESYKKGVPFDLETAYEAAYKNATKRTMLPWRDGEAEELTKCYHENGFFPALEEDEEETLDKVHPFENRQSVAVTIEQAYDDYCVSVLAKALGKDEEAKYFLDRSMKYQKLYDASIGFFHPKKINGEFTKVYNPKWCGGQGGRKYFAENNAYIYNFAAQHDVEGMIELHGGKDAFSGKLDNLYVEQYDGVLKSTFLMQYPDATGLMGQFCMGNEPSFHIPYLYNYAGEAYKTQRKIHELIDLWFTNSPLGICGDEDGGAMSAFLAFSAMGFYPVNPASGNYDIGSPIFDKIEIDMPNGGTFTIVADGAGGKAKYIQSAALDGSELSSPILTHDQLLSGKTLCLVMGNHPNKALWA
ncbi:MAG: GH92 family glycosyl hydrolase [Clostridia bacterium]|nr:GH92 family glycosyl hydrolase [Clostridia bacterium]